MPRLEITKAPVTSGSGYPEPYRSQMAGRSARRLGDLAGLTQFGVNIVMLEPGAPASLRHWHLKEDEFAMVLSGELVLIEDEGETTLQPGDCAAWKAGVSNGHRFINRSPLPASFLVVGSKSTDDVCTYSDVDMKIHMGGDKPHFTYHDGSEWTGPRDLAPKGDNK
ncbi:MAG: cupin domain-containing protein [Pararhodobacter sp.]|nr:cupin domain-containing protein [Pararhodobacter sp.]